MTQVFSVGGQEYRANVLNAFEQLEVARLMRDPLASLAMVETERDPKAPEPTSRTFAQLIAATSGGLSKAEITDAIGLCLSKVERRAGQNWAPIRTLGATGLTLNYVDIQLAQMLEIVWHVLKLNGLVDFFSVARSEPTTEGNQVKLVGIG